MGFIEVADLSSKLPGGRVLFEDVSFRVYSGQHAALIGANGVGKTTLLRILAGSDEAKSGAMRIDGRLLYMRQMIGSISDDTTVRRLLLSLAPVRIIRAAHTLEGAEAAVAVPHEAAADERYAHALTAWGDAGGYETEVLWEVCTTQALG